MFLIIIYLSQLLNIQETITAEQAAKTVVEYLVENNLGEHVQYTTKAGGFKIKLTGIEPPSNIKEALQLCTSSISSTFKGSGKVRTRFLGKQLLEEDDIENLMGSCDTFEAGLQEAFNNFQKKKAKFAEEMFEDMDRLDFKFVVLYKNRFFPGPQTA